MGGEKDLPLNERKSKANVTQDIFMMFDLAEKILVNYVNFRAPNSTK